MVKIDYSSLIGTITYGNGKIVNVAEIFAGKNCLAAVTYEDSNKTCTRLIRRIYTHFNDENHIKWELGLDADNATNWMDLEQVTTIRLFKDHPVTPILAKYLVQATWAKDVTLELISRNENK